MDEKAWWIANEIPSGIKSMRWGWLSSPPRTPERHIAPKLFGPKISECVPKTTLFDVIGAPSLMLDSLGSQYVRPNLALWGPWGRRQRPSEGVFFSFCIQTMNTTSLWYQHSKNGLFYVWLGPPCRRNIFYRGHWSVLFNSGSLVLCREYFHSNARLVGW